MRSNFAILRQKIIAYSELTRLNRPIGILLLLWPTYWALWVAGAGLPALGVFIIFTLGVIVMRSAGCAINDYADRKVDGHVARTRNRPLVRGVIRPKEALAVFAGLLLVALVLVLQLNRLTIALSLVAVVLAVTYPLGKRWHQLPQLQLGLAFGWSIPMGFAAQTGTVPAIAWVLFAANVFWTIAYDTLYAMADRLDDVKIGVKSTAILFGRFDLFIVSLLYAAALACLGALGWLSHYPAGYYLVLTLAGVLAVFIVRGANSRTPSVCMQAFKRNNGFGALIMLALMVAQF
ncbi:MAG TPA: 4-hydroxybenzoate octaprenyltransferase [Halothiobacillus sp.]|nr:4-hydroxybenzoate octaprenyltransferase [Halothiobacillus sp.]HQS29320.1 4-hydroxybenzoate octaprenyltransferase [Halothiobacillus sp.]